MAATFPSPAAGSPMAPATGRCASNTELSNRQNQSSGARNMMRKLLSSGLLRLCLFACALALPTSRVAAEELPVRKAGLWEMKIVQAGSPLPEMTMQHCTDETTDKEMSTAFSPMRQGDLLQAGHAEDRDRLCQRFRRAASRRVDHVACRDRRRFQFRLHRKTSSRTARGRPARRSTPRTTIEAKWLGACKPDQKPGDIVMPGGFKMNIKDMEKLKGLMPKNPAQAVGAEARQTFARPAPAPSRAGRPSGCRRA